MYLYIYVCTHTHVEYWYDMYLKDRRSIVLNHNPGIVFKQDPRTPSQVRYNIIIRLTQVWSIES